MSNDGLEEQVKIIKRVLREFECIDYRSYQDVGGSLAYANLDNLMHQIKQLRERVEHLQRDAAEHCVERSETGPTVTEEPTSDESAATRCPNCGALVGNCFVWCPRNDY